MIGTGYRKLARELGLTISNRVAYGPVQGYMTTLSEGMGYKDLFISLRFPTPEANNPLAAQLGDAETRKRFRIRGYELTETFVYVSFIDNPGTLKRIREFISWFYPQISQTGALGIEYCPECAQKIEGEASTRFINGNAFNMHPACAEKIADAFEEQSEMVKYEKGNSGRGFIGALLGGILGSIPWAVVYALGWFVGWLGLLIGFLAQKGYFWLGGRLKRSAIVIIALAIILAVIFGQLLGDCISIGYYILNGELEGFVLTDIPDIIYLSFELKPDYVRIFWGNIVMGLLFAFLGAYSVLRDLHRQVKARTPVIK